MKIGTDKRHLVNDDGTPFFYLADTVWNLFYSIPREEVYWYLEQRKQQGFNVIMACLVREGGIEKALNTQGDGPFINDDPARPNGKFFQHADAILDKAAELGLAFALLPTWGEYVTPAWGKGPKIFTEENMRLYGGFLGKRYKDRNLVWVTGGDREPVTEEDKAIWRAEAAGLAKGDGGTHLKTYHPQGGTHSAAFFHNEPWLDFNMMQSGKHWDMPYYEKIWQDYDLTPAKPTVEGEGQYENSHENFTKKTGARINAHQVRKCAYNAVLAGGLGFTYGCRDVFFFYGSDKAPVLRDMDTPWKEAVNFPGAVHMGHLRKVMEENRWAELTPDRENKLVIGGCGTGGTYAPAAYSADAGIAMIYIPETMALKIDPSVLAGKVKAQWFDPVTGEYADAGKMDGEPMIIEPLRDRDNPDRVLVLKAERIGRV